MNQINWLDGSWSGFELIGCTWVTTTNPFELAAFD
jgi:hypothetical protein